MNPKKVAFTHKQNLAIDFARAHHKTQRRKGTVLPYIIHPIEVAYFCGVFWPDKEDLILAAYLHDTIEDTDATFESISDSFGQEVAVLVNVVTGRKKDSWKETRLAQIEQIQYTSWLDGVRLKAADMLSNAGSIARDYRLMGDAAFYKFKSSTKKDVTWYYESMLDVFRRKLPEDDLFICEEIQRQIDEWTD